ncbi:beta-ketoacyl synthase N-terminal-like domain-containing protein, partial [Umezawaea sp.]|uniref:beta-ketoacyl synthase N-terminal-like domain-containing protein n=1 Tax=Umezawaea sp. TaxID=1955258 RepID=UPI002ED4D479
MFSAHLVRTIPESIAANARRFGDRIAFADDRRSVGFAELADRTGRLAGHLSASGVRRGDRVVLLMGNEVETLEAYLAVTRASAVGVPVNPLSSDAELAHVLSDSGAVAVVAGRGALDRARRVAGDLRVVPVEDGTFDRLATTEPDVGPSDDLGLDEPAWMLYTSGTTGTPKGVLSSQRACLWSIAAAYAPVLGLSEHDHVLWPLPLFHSLSHVLCVVGVTTVGASAKVLVDFDADRVLAALADESFTLLAGVPAVYHRLVAAHVDSPAPALRAALCTGAVAPADLREEFERVVGVPLVDSYGSTETCGAITMTRPGDVVPPGSCGKPVDGLRVRLVDSAGAEADEGEVWVSGPNLMLGYHNAPEPAVVDGWYRTGDVASKDADGHLTIRGRIKDVIIRGGENLHPVEVEDVLSRVPGVADVGVAGRPHPVLGEVPVAYLVADGPIDPAAAMAACRAALSPFKVPAELLLVDEVPRTRSGKTKRHALAELPSRILSVEGADHEALHRVNWVPAEGSAGAGRTPAERRPADPALVDPTPLERTPVVRPPVVRTLVVADLPEGPALADRVVAEVERLLAESPTPLVVRTSRAVRTSPDDLPPDPEHAAVLGRLRGLRSEHVVVVDGEGADVSADVPAGEPLVAIRSGAPLVPRLGRAAAGPVPVTIDVDRTVLVTGDPNGAAGAVADHHRARHGARRVVVVEHRAGDPALDLTDPTAVAAVLDTAGPLALVVHAMGEGPRAAVARRFDEAVGDSCPQVFFCSAVGDAEDAVVEALAARRANAVSVAWGHWEAEPRSAAPDWLPSDAITVEGGMALVDAARSSGESAVVAAAVRLTGLRDVPPLLRDLVPEAAPAGRAAELRVKLAGAPGLLLDLVRSETGRVLGRAVAAADVPFREQGLTSVASVGLRARLSTATGLDVPVTALYDHPTPRALAEHLLDVLAGREAEDLPVVDAVDDDPVVVVGMACRLPGGVTSPDEFWDLVAAGRDAIGPFPTDRGWPEDLVDHSGERPGTSSVHEGGFLEDIAGFDADFFGISPREALAMDPQHRLLLEVSWEVLERAGIAPTSLRGSRTGVFTGLMFHDYAGLAERSDDDLEGHLSVGTAGSVASGRVAYTFGFEGPALTIDTACSSSLVAMHLAAQSLRRGECSLALAGGAAVMSTPSVFVEFSRQQGLAADGRCKSFSADADGTAWGEGVGVLLLEKLSDARRNGHRVLAVIRGSAVNQDGASNGLTAPNGLAQQRV